MSPVSGIKWFAPTMIPHMDIVAIVILGVLVLVMLYHTATYGRRGRRWGGF